MMIIELINQCLAFLPYNDAEIILKRIIPRVYRRIELYKSHIKGALLIEREALHGINARVIYNPAFGFVYKILETSVPEELYKMATRYGPSRIKNEKDSAYIRYSMKSHP